MWHVPHVECVLVQEAHAHAVAAHTNGGHFGRDLMVLALKQKYFWYNMQHLAVEAMTKCAKYKGFDV